ncbi:MAG: cohesin domain-containing protein [bacterium]
MGWLTNAKLLAVLWIGIGLSFLTGDCFAQKVQNQVKVDYKDTIGSTYTTESNIIITPITEIITNIRISPAQTTIDVLGTFTLEVVVESVTDLFGMQFDILFDKDILEVVSVSEGIFLKSDGVSTFWLAPTITPGKIDNVADTRLGTNTGVSGTGTLAVIEFRAKGLGTSVIDLQNVTFVNGSLSTISTNVFDGTVTSTTNTAVKVIPPFTSSYRGEEFEVAIVAKAVHNLFAYQFDVQFDPTILEVVSVTEGDFPGTDGASTVWQVPVIGTGTIINAGATRLGTQTGVSGTGTLAVVRFKAKTIGTSTVDLLNVILTDNSYPIPQTIPAVIEDGTVTIIPYVDLWVTKVGLLANAFAGGTATYIIEYGNRGTDTANGVQLIDIFPPEMESIISQTAPVDINYSPSTKRGTWNIGSVLPGTYSFTLQIRILPETPGSTTIANRIHIIAPGTETNYTNNYATATTHILIYTIDLWVIKQGQAEVTPGEIATYTITYGNKGNATCYGVQLCDQFPDQMQALIYQNSGYPFLFNPMTKYGTWNIDILPPGTYSFKMSIKIRNDAVGSSSIINTIKITSPAAEIYLPNNYSTATTHVSRLDIDLWVTKEGPISLLPGGIATYTITYGNNGGTTAYGVQLCDQFPDQMQTLVYQNSGLPFEYGTLTKQGTWSIANLPKGTYSFEVTIRIKENIKGSTTIRNMVKIAYPGIEDNYTNNQATATTHITDPDLEIWKYGNSWILTNQQITYTIYYRNRGNTSAENVTITDYLPAGVIYGTDTSGVSPTIIYGTPTKIIWNIGTKTPNYWYDQFQITAWVTDMTTSTTKINNVIEIRTTSSETSYANNRATLTTTVEAARADVSVSKYLTSQNAVRGQEITYSIYCYSNGNIPAGSVTITDYLPQGLKYISNTVIGSPTITGSVTSGGQILTWQLGTMNAGWDYRQFQITALITDSAPATIKNVAEITTPTPERNYTNNRATVTTKVESPKIDLYIYKSGPNKINPGLNTITYNIYYGNYGNIPASGATITDTLLPPATGTIIYGTDTSGFMATYTHSYIEWVVGTVNPGTYKYFSLTLIVTKDNNGNYVPGSTTLMNEIKIEPISTDVNPNNNFSKWNTHVEHPKIDLEIIKRGPYEILSGEKITYTIQYRNSGSVDAGSTTIKDTLPSGVTYASDTSGFVPGTTSPQVIWELGTRAMTGARNWVIFQMTCNVAPDILASTTLANRIEISTNDAETHYYNNVCTWTTHIIPPKADLHITKYKTQPYEVTPGCEVTYCLAYNNCYGNVPATNTIITDILPGSVTFISCTGNGTLTATGTVKWDIGTLTKGGGYGYVYLTVRVNDDVEGTLTNVVEITSDTPDLDSADNRATCTVPIADWYADVQISKSGLYDIQPGKTLRYYITYGNYYGNIAATNTTIIDTLPHGVTYATDTSGFPLTIGSGTLTWQVGTLASRYSNYFYLDVNVSPDLKGSTTIVNKIEIKTNTYEKFMTNNYASWKTHIIPEDVDLEIAKYCPVEAAQGQEFEYRLIYRNPGKAPAENVKISDILPNELTYVSSSLTPATITGNNIIWEIGTLPAWAYRDLTLRVKVKDDVPASSTITNVVEITTSNLDTNYTNNKATCTTHICLPDPVLKIRKWQHRSNVTAGQRMDYYIRYSNEGKGPAGSVTITDFLPLEVSYVTDDSGFSHTLSDNKVIWQVGTLNAMTSKDFKLTVLVDKYVYASTTLTNVIEINTPHHQTTDRCTCTTHVLEPITDVLIYKFGPDEVSYGTEFNYEITYNNNSVSDADGVVIKDILDPQLIYDSDTSGRTPTISGNEITWYIGTMTAWSSGHFLLTVKVPYSVQASTTLTNVIEITTLTSENRYNNNRATVTIHIDSPKVDVGIEKKGDDARPGFKKTYHITYYNRGTEQAEDVVIVDTLPPEVEYLSSSGGGNYDSASRTVTWNIGSLPPQTERYLTVEVRIPSTQQCGINLYNYIEITTTSPESDYTNNKFTEIETVVTSIDPNDKLVSPQKYIRDNELLNYTIRFENQATATASAILITIEDQLSDKLDWTTMKFGLIKIGEGTYTLENFDRGSLACSYDVGSGTIRWEFDFKTGANGLPANVVSPEGEGYVCFSVNAKSGLPAGTEITNRATIRFDYNPAMDTPLVTNIVDLNKPTSTVIPLAATQSSISFAVRWAGTDTAGNKPGEIENYTIYVSDNNGTWTKWLDETVAISDTFTGKTGHSYKFYSLAKDRAKNDEVKTPQVEAQTSLTIQRHLTIATLSTTQILVGQTLSLTLSIYDTSGNLVTDYVGTATLQDKSGVLGEAVFNGTGTWTGEIIIPQIPNGGTNAITVSAPGVGDGVSDILLMGLDYYVGGTVTLWTPGIGTTTISFGSGTFIQSWDFYIIINCITPPNIPDNGIKDSAREILAYNAYVRDTQIMGTFTKTAYLEIPYQDADQNGFVDGTAIKESTLRLYVWENDQWQEMGTSGVDTDRNVVWCQLNHLSTFMPMGILVAPSTLGNVAVYPNPFKPNSGLGHEYITFGSKREISRRLTSYATIKIYTVAGDLVKTLEVTPQDNGQKIWYADNDSGNKVASGVYIYLITNPQGEKCIGKLAIIR